MTSPALPTSADVLAAAKRIAGHATVTPVLRNQVLDERLGATVLLKAECLQVIGAFKFRGAYNRLSQLDPAQRERGVVAWSSGNHAQGVAAAARQLGIRAAIVMPNDAPAIKTANTRALGAEIVGYDRYTQDREQIGRDLAREREAVIVPPYDDPHIIAGQGTAALELAAQTQALVGRDMDLFLAPCGGGGLIAGSALALESASPQTQLYGVEPAAYDDTARSFRSGKREKNEPGATSVCDALMAVMPGEFTFEINRQRLAGVLTVSDEAVLDAVAFAWRELKVVVEPGGAAALAALLHGGIDCRGRTVGIILSGGNVDQALYREALARAVR